MIHGCKGSVIAVCALMSSGLSLAAYAGCMDNDNPLWTEPGEKSVRNRLISLMRCPLDVDRRTSNQIDAVACNWFVAHAVDELYGVKDFTPQTNGRWLTANEIASFVRTHPEKWTKLGMANVQSVLDDAARGAANDQPVVAVLEGNPHGHVALILPGAPKASSTWRDANGVVLRAPNSAAFSLNNVARAYVSCRLSAAFSDPNRVEIWWRLKEQ